MRKNCETCKHDRLKTPVCDECYKTSDAPTKWEPAGHYKPDTNAERIRAMSDEALCEFLSQYVFHKMCEEGCDACTYNGDCDKRLLEWLRQPAEEDENE